ncbi:hypothetical protein SAMN05216228_1005106 [Rhizobium tibeticum]|uniref:Uncharacterized protein n=1 Tax=Rhizobium tibeticum TaxID=501024 RepID=A0A1H8HBL0_9HYPH|nr:hypothetical protein [Rhizobium tibeticum]SEH65300.1 hypothetical protein RTCCBAU85039_1612 [Rhizobium tibeticum]SEN53424.1 hypothetical protein SAMN05216228_1005106 [Rhizobium tibeticum]
MSSGSSIKFKTRFANPFVPNARMIALEAGTYRLSLDEEENEGLQFSAFRRTRTHLEIPATATRIDTRQRLSVFAGHRNCLPKNVSTGE